MKKIITIFLISLVFLPQFIKADGVIFPNPGYMVRETNQKAAILYQNKQETLVISTGFQGNARDFSWIVPTPSQPEVSKISKDFFDNLEKLTKVDYGDINYKAMSLMESANDLVTILEEKTLGYYDITVLKSQDKDALFNWLNENNYTFPEKGKYILNDYINLDWTFTAVKITQDALEDNQISNNLLKGDIAPLKFVFETDKIVYPLKISGITKFQDLPAEAIVEQKISQNIHYYPDYSSIDLYIFANNKKTLQGFFTIYANWINAKDIKNLGVDEKGNDWVDVSHKYFLTKVSSEIFFDNMEDDLYPRDASDNSKVGVTPWIKKTINNIGMNFVLIIILLLLLFFIPIYWQFKKSSKLCKIICWIIQIISLAIYLLIVYNFIIDYVVIDYNSVFSYSGIIEYSFFCISCYCIPFLMVLVIIYQSIFSKKINC